MHQNIIKLLVSNKGKGFFKAENKATDEATIYLYDVIVSDDWFGGVTPLAFAKQLAGISAATIHLRINSPGGDVFAARAMQQAMREHSSKFIAHIDGIAASAATFLVMSADESVISQGSMFMVHNAWSIAMGNAKDFVDMANLLTKIDGSISADYVNKTGQSEQQIKEWMDAETYFMDQEAVDAGFVNAVADKNDVKNKISWDLSAYQAPPEQKTADPAPAALQNIESAQNTVIQPDHTAADDMISNHTKNRPKLRAMMSF